MKTIKNYLLLIGLCLIVGSSCTSNFEEINKNPNQPEYGEINPANLLQVLTMNASDRWLIHTYTLNGELIQYTVSGTSNNAYHRFVIPNTTTAGSWNWYARMAATADEMERLAIKRGDVNCEAIAITLKVMFMSNLTDCFGDVPYSEAFGNINGTKINKPKFDKQRDIYEKLYEQLEYANTLYNTDAAFDSSRDLLYNGDISKWRKFNNSLYLRLLMRLSNRDKEFAVSKKIQEIYLNRTKYPVFESNDDNATLHFDEVEPFVNYYGSYTQAAFGSSSRKACATMIKMMLGPGDPRLPIYYTQSGGAWEGRVSGLPNAELETEGKIAYLNYETLGRYQSPVSFMKYDEVMFIFCEAIWRGWIPGGETLGEQYYLDGIKSSIAYWSSIDPAGTDITELTINRFLNKSPYSHELETIMNQKYIALFWTGYEAWHEYRRTGFPSLPIGAATSNDHILPRRFCYPDNTSITNPDNYAEACARLQKDYYGGDDMKTPVWWGKNAIERGIE
ncbi:MAG: SusD/RagB family nutrient-binding outer membrane lipoprotein [Alistipes sp.]|nr:SusD/RagB family nutrient-binding outer membrane lipoprotein [Alistipes sp.]